MLAPDKPAEAASKTGISRLIIAGGINPAPTKTGYSGKQVPDKP